MTIRRHDLDIVSDGYRLAAAAAVPEHPRGVVALLHGIPSTAPPDPDDEGYPGLAMRLADAGWLAGWISLRGVNGSQGSFSIEGWVRDASAFVHALRDLAPGGLRLALVGSSGGGAVAATTAARGAPVDAVALLAAPAEWTSFAADASEGIQRITIGAGLPVDPSDVADPSGWADEFTRVSAADAVARLSVPVLVVHGTADDVVPVAHAEILRTRAPRARVHILDRAPHQLRRVPQVFEILSAWLDEVIG